MKDQVRLIADKLKECATAACFRFLSNQGYVVLHGQVFLDHVDYTIKAHRERQTETIENGLGEVVATVHCPPLPSPPVTERADEPGVYDWSNQLELDAWGEL